MGQMMICVTLKSSSFNEVAKQLVYDHPKIYDKYIPSSFKTSHPDVQKLFKSECFYCFIMVETWEHSALIFYFISGFLTRQYRYFWCLLSSSTKIFKTFKHAKDGLSRKGFLLASFSLFEKKRVILLWFYIPKWNLSYLEPIGLINDRWFLIIIYDHSKLL